MGNSYLDQEAAIREVGRGYDKLKQLHGLLQLKSGNGDEAVHTQELVQPLLIEALQALNYALGIMRSAVGKVGVKSEIAVASGSPGYSSSESLFSSDTNQKTKNEKGKRRRVRENSWTNDTIMPYDDGHQWRKYGNKKVIDTNFSRAYFRCTYKEQGCEAKKIVQQTSNSEPHMFKVTYINTHTCNFIHRTISPSSPIQPSSFGLMEQDSSVNKMPHLQECKLSSSQLLNQSSCSSDAILTETFTSASMVERNYCEWDINSLLRDLEIFASDDFPLI